MEAELKYKVISSKKQYYAYCDKLEVLLTEKKSAAVRDEISLLSLLIETWDKAHDSFDDLDPVALIKALMSEHGLRSVDMVDIMGVSKGMVSQILHKKKGLSKAVIRNLADHFKMNHEAFNRPYTLVSEVNKKYRYANLMNSPKDISEEPLRKSA